MSKVNWKEKKKKDLLFLITIIYSLKNSVIKNGISQLVVVWLFESIDALETKGIGSFGLEGLFLQLDRLSKCIY